MTDFGSQFKRIWSWPVAPLLWVCGEAVHYGSGYSILPACFMMARKYKDGSDSWNLLQSHALLSSLSQCRLLSISVLTVQVETPFPRDLYLAPQRSSVSPAFSRPAESSVILPSPLLSFTCLVDDPHQLWPCYFSAHSSHFNSGHDFLGSLQIS